MYCITHSSQNCAGSASYVLSTHALLTSVGVGAGALPAGAAIAWVLKGLWVFLLLRSQHNRRNWFPRSSIVCGKVWKVFGC